MKRHVNSTMNIRSLEFEAIVQDAKTENTDINLKSEFNIDLIKSEIDKKYKKLSRGIQIKEGDKEDKIYLPFKKEETRESSIKKIL